MATWPSSIWSYFLGLRLLQLTLAVFSCTLSRLLASNLFSLRMLRMIGLCHGIEAEGLALRDGLHPFEAQIVVQRDQVT